MDCSDRVTVSCFDGGVYSSSHALDMSITGGQFVPRDVTACNSKGSRAEAGRSEFQVSPGYAMRLYDDEEVHRPGTARGRADM